jgi:hypothetical protein
MRDSVSLPCLQLQLLALFAAWGKSFGLCPTSMASSLPTSNGTRSGPIYSGTSVMMGLEGLVSKHRDRPYRGGRSPHWIKVKNRQHPALQRVMEAMS